MHGTDVLGRARAHRCRVPQADAAVPARRSARITGLTDYRTAYPSSTAVSACRRHRIADNNRHDTIQALLSRDLGVLKLPATPTHGRPTRPRLAAVGGSDEGRPARTHRARRDPIGSVSIRPGAAQADSNFRNDKHQGSPTGGEGHEVHPTIRADYAARCWGRVAGKRFQLAFSRWAIMAVIANAPDRDHCRPEPARR